MSVHVGFFSVCHCASMLVFHNYYFHTFCINFWLCWSIWNAAGFYMDHFAKKYEASLVKLEAAELRHYAGGRRPLLLFPGEGARPLTEHDAAANNCLVVIDGTWEQAQKRNQAVKTLIVDRGSKGELVTLRPRCPRR